MLLLPRSGAATLGCALACTLASTATVARADVAIDRDTVLTLASDLGGDDDAGRVVGTDGNRRARERLIAELRARGVSPAGDSGTYVQRFTIGGVEVANVLGIVRPAGTASQAPTVLLSAHYDGVGDCEVLPVAAEHEVSDVCNSVADNLAGVAAIFGILDAIADDLQSPVAVAFFDGEEADEVMNELGGSLDRGLLGSVHFARTPTFDTRSLRLHVNLESIGFVAFEGMEHHVFAVGAHSGGAALESDVRRSLASSDYGLDAQLGHYSIAQKRTDLEGFVRSGWQVPFVILMNGPVGTYHTSADDFARVSWDSVVAIAEATADLVVRTAATNPRYAYAGNFGALVLNRDVLYAIPFAQLVEVEGWLLRALEVVDPVAHSATVADLQAGLERVRNYRRSGAWLWGINWVPALQWIPDTFAATTRQTRRVLAPAAP